MDANQVRQLEEDLGIVIAEVLRERFPGPQVSPRTTHLMAKAAVAVLEAVAEKSASGRPRDPGH